MRNIQHFHLFNRRRTGESHPFATVALGVNDKQQPWMTVAVCGHKDNFSRKIGAAIARGRLAAGKGTLVTTDDFGKMIGEFIQCDEFGTSLNPKWAWLDVDRAYPVFKSVLDDVVWKMDQLDEQKTKASLATHA
jgi:hypothetical protein